MPPTYAADYVAPRSRLTTFFRAILCIPHLILLGLWGVVVYFAVIIAWFALLITGRYPQGLYDFVAGFNRATTAFYGYYLLLTDEFPPFSGDTGGYPVRLHVGPPQASYSRVLVFFRFILAIPVFIILYVMQLIATVGAFLAWFAIVILGRQPEGLQEMINLGLSYQSRATAYLCLLTDQFPTFASPPEQRGAQPAFSQPTTGT